MEREPARQRAKELGERLRPLFSSEPSVAAAYVFGSVARGEAGPESDLDIGLVYRAREGNSHERIAARLSVQIGRAAGVEMVDVVDLELQGPIFAHEALCSGFLIYEGDRQRRVDFESDTIVRALDFRPTYDLATQSKPAALRRWLRERYDLRTDSVEARHPESESREAR